MQAKSYASFLQTVQRERAQSTLPKRNIAIKVVDCIKYPGVCIASIQFISSKTRRVMGQPFQQF